jgi:hypothetical protein
MDSASISAFAALGGAVIGGLTSFATSWLTQQTQTRAQQLAHKLTRREELYKDFIEEGQSYMRTPLSIRHLTSPSYFPVKK